MTLAGPWFLLLGLLVPLALLFRRRRGEASLRFAPGSLIRAEALPRTWRVRLRLLPRVLVIAGLLLVTVALARPVRRVAVPETREGIDILLALDTSSSMASNDLDPERTRLDAAKAAAARFVEDRPDDRIGLVCFARYPDLRCPPTLDHDALGQILSEVALVENDGPEDATGIGTAVARAAQVLESGRAKSRVVVLLTDGEENVATKDKPGEIAPLHAAQLCRRLSTRVYTIVAGRGGRDRKGEWVALDTKDVRRLAERTGGRYFEARDAGALQSVYSEIGALATIAFEEPRYRTEEAFLPFLAVALALLLLGRLLESRPVMVLP